jgi:hypothetical protein
VSLSRKVPGEVIWFHPAFEICSQGTPTWMPAMRFIRLFWQIFSGIAYLLLSLG